MKNKKKIKVKILRAKKKDFPSILKLINELAVFEKLAPPKKAAIKRLKKDAFGKNPKFKVLVAVSGKEIVAYAFYFFTYSSFLAKPTLYLEDFYVKEDIRRFGIGKKIFDELIKISRKEKCGRMEWCVLDWNKNAIAFYDKAGAKALNDWIYYRVVF